MSKMKQLHDEMVSCAFDTILDNHLSYDPIDLDSRIFIKERLSRLYSGQFYESYDYLIDQACKLLKSL